jgi:hypothetical protein
MTMTDQSDTTTRTTRPWFCINPQTLAKTITGAFPALGTVAKNLAARASRENPDAPHEATCLPDHVRAEFRRWLSPPPRPGRSAGELRVLEDDERRAALESAARAAAEGRPLDADGLATLIFLLVPERSCLPSSDTLRIARRAVAENAAAPQSAAALPEAWRAALARHPRYFPAMEPRA